MKKINFTKIVASGNDFVVVDSLSRYLVISLKKLAQEICDRKFGVGADGLLFLEKTKVADVKMRIFNPDGSEAEMCGNGARCVAFYLGSRFKVSATRRGGPANFLGGQGSRLKIETKAGIINSEFKGENIKIKLTDPKGIKLDIPIKIDSRLLKVNFINTGVPHTVIFVEGLDKIDVANLGRQIRYHHKFKPAGTNVDFVEVLTDDSIKIRTYERGVEDETLACGTGSVASALIFVARLPLPAGQAGVCPFARQIDIITKSGEILKVYFERLGNNFRNVWLEGKARIVYKGVYHV